MIDLHYWPTPNGWKVSIMIEERGLPYALKPVNIGRGEQFSPEFLALSPNNRMPAIGDHRHVRGKETAYRFVSLAKLRRDFESDVRRYGGEDEEDSENSGIGR
jgi:GST-like protein